MELLQVIAAMAADNNKGIRMTTTITNVKKVKQGSIVSFGTDDKCGNSAQMQQLGLETDDICAAFFIDKKELEKYKTMK